MSIARNARYLPFAVAVASGSAAGLLCHLDDALLLIALLGVSQACLSFGYVFALTALIDDAESGGEKR